MFVDEVRLAFVLEQDCERIEALDDAAQLEAVHQVNGHNGTLPLAFGKKCVLKAGRH